MDTAYICETLQKLGERKWPREWGAQEEGEIGDFFGWCHRYRAEPPADDAIIAQFEKRYGVKLPSDYRKFLSEVGNGAGGPGYGIWTLGKGEDGPLPNEMLEQLSTPFAHTDAWNDAALLREDRGYPDEEYYAYKIIAGAMEIATDGCALYHLLVVTGPAKGQVWYDKRTEGKGIEPVRNDTGKIMHFGEWYLAWLEDARAKFG